MRGILAPTLRSVSTPEDILAIYEAKAAAYAQARAAGPDTAVEKRWLDRLIEGTAPPVRVLDLGCGSGTPIATYLTQQGCHLTGVDGAEPMLKLFAANLPHATTHLADMRALELGQRFEALVAWDSFFHLSPADQEAMFPVFARHASPGARLLFTSGPAEGVAIGTVDGAPVYHSSQAPQTYRRWLERAGFVVCSFVPEDPDCGQHSVWLAQRTR